MEDPSFTIRPAIEADRDDVIRLFRQYGFGQHGPDWADHCIRQEKTAMFLAMAGDRAVAFGRVAIVEDGQGHIYDLYTDPEHRKRGIAGAMMQACEDWAQEKQAQSLHLNVYEENDTAMDLYKKRGYAIAFNQASSATWVSHAPESHHFMIKPLNGPA